MPDYHLLTLNEAGDAAARTAFSAVSDEAAIAQAAAHDGPHGCELWAADRFVAFWHKAWPKDRVWGLPGRKDLGER